MAKEPTVEGQKPSFESLDPVAKNTALKLYLHETFSKRTAMRRRNAISAQTFTNREPGAMRDIFSVAMDVAMATLLNNWLKDTLIPKPMKDFIVLYAQYVTRCGEGEDFEAMVWFHDTEEGIFSNDPKEIEKLTVATHKMLATAYLKGDKDELETQLFDSDTSPIWNIIGEWNELDGGNFVLK